MTVSLSVLKQIILENQRDIPRKTLVERGEKFDAAASYVLVGLRRVGKSYTLFEYIQRMLRDGQMAAEDVLYVNFEDDRLYNFAVTDFEALLTAYHELFGAERQPTVFLDELQNIDGWEKFARRLADTGHRAFLTGSNAKMLSSEIHTTLGARFLMRVIHPFTFREFLKFQGLTVTPLTLFSPEARDVRRWFDDYLNWGGLAPVFPLSEKREWLQGLRDNVLLKDIAARQGIRSTEALTMLVRKLAESVMQPTSVTRLVHLLQSAHMTTTRVTLPSWLQALRSAYLVESLSNYREALPERMTQQKHYFTDNGILRCMLSDPTAKLLENLTAVELLRRYGSDRVFYYRNGVEVDFYIPEASMAVQVSVSINDPETYRRETRALVKLKAYCGCRQCLILTMDEEKIVEENGVTIDVKPVWKWLLEASPKN